MHASNRAFWAYCEKKYESHFHLEGGKVLEVGSMDINGSVRDYFKGYSEYVGVDWRPGKAVDVVCLAHEMQFDHKFDVVISASMLEHDPHWEKSIPKMVEYLKDDGILLLSWGAALNPPHEHEAADDFCFHSLPAYKVLELLKGLGVYVHEFRYEGKQFAKMFEAIKQRKQLSHFQAANLGLGEVCLVAFKDAAWSVGEPHHDKMVREDRRPKGVDIKDLTKDMGTKDIVWGPIQDDVTYVGNTKVWSWNIESPAVEQQLEKSQTNEMISKMMENVNHHLQEQIIHGT